MEHKLLNTMGRDRTRNGDVRRTSNLKEDVTTATHAKCSWGYVTRMDTMKWSRAVTVWNLEQVLGT
jgi:hypothetical protein